MCHVYFCSKSLLLLSYIELQNVIIFICFERLSFGFIAFLLWYSGSKHKDYKTKMFHMRTIKLAKISWAKSHKDNKNIWWKRDLDIFEVCFKYSMQNALSDYSFLKSQLIIMSLSRRYSLKIFLDIHQNYVTESRGFAWIRVYQQSKRI